MAFCGKEIIIISDSDASDDDIIIIGECESAPKKPEAFPMTTAQKLMAAEDSKASEEIPEQFICCICYTNIRKVVFISCGHGACANCTRKWYNISGEDGAFQCVLCDATVVDITVIF